MTYSLAVVTVAVQAGLTVRAVPVLDAISRYSPLPGPLVIRTQAPAHWSVVQDLPLLVSTVWLTDVGIPRSPLMYKTDVVPSSRELRAYSAPSMSNMNHLPVQRAAVSRKRSCTVVSALQAAP